MPLGFPAAAVRSALGYVAGPGDIFVASYPKCGTTWLQYIVWLLVRGRPLAPDETLAGVFPHLEESGADAVRALAAPRLVKTHLPLERTPYAPAARYLLIARNPFDCVVSFYHHTRGFPRHYEFADGTLTDFFACFLDGRVDFGDYFDHLRSWEPAFARDNVLFLTFEDLKADTPRELRRIAAFLGRDAEARIGTAEGLRAVLAESGIDAMRRNQQRWSSRRPDWAPPFVRRGAVGDWRRELPPDLTRALLAKFDERLAGSRLAGLWPAILARARAHARA